MNNKLKNNEQKNYVLNIIFLMKKKIEKKRLEFL